MPTEYERRRDFLQISILLVLSVLLLFISLTSFANQYPHPDNLLVLGLGSVFIFLVYILFAWELVNLKKY